LKTGFGFEDKIIVDRNRRLWWKSFGTLCKRQTIQVEKSMMILK